MPARDDPSDRPRRAAPVAAYLERLHARHAPTAGGEVATYIPELAEADPAWFGICLVTVDGTVHETGDTHQEHTIQSVSKPFTFALTLDELGPAVVHRHVGVEPTGDPFNSIALDPATGAALNPMVNAGAITTAGLVAGERPGGALEHLLATYGAFAGRPLVVDERTYQSERSTGHRNRAIAHLLRGSGALVADPELAVDLYFRQCSVAVDCHDLAVMAATLANGGRNPLTGVLAATPSTVRRTLTVMASCGMYDGAGEWLYTVGLPAKSGVSGAIIAVLPGQFGLAVFSPPLDEQGNSVRGVAVCRDLSREMDLHLVRASHHPAATIRSVYTLAQVGSQRQRSAAEVAELARHGSDVLVFELQGDLDFQAAELVTRRIVDASVEPTHVVLDLRRVGNIEGSLEVLLADVHADISARDGELVLTGATAHPELIAHLQSVAADAGRPAPRTFDDLDLALEWCEDRLGASSDVLAPDRVELVDHELLSHLDAETVERFARHVERRNYAAGDFVVRHGETVPELVLVVSGHLSVTVPLPDGGARRVATLAGGMLVGETSLALSEPRLVDVRADTGVECQVLTRDALSEIRSSDPLLWTGLLEAVVRIQANRATRIRHELVQLSE
jgi:glutaminase